MKHNPLLKGPISISDTNDRIIFNHKSYMIISHAIEFGHKVEDWMIHPKISRPIDIR